tara:strand:+ start:2816 stop:4087 length:1272 start_codon:yes stop_codon:yes gene_type:complete
MKKIYACFITLLFPIFVLIIYFRKFIGKEDPLRFKEKFNLNYLDKIQVNEKKIIWFHAVSIGEVLSIFPMITKLNNKRNDLEFLITSVTKSSADLIEKEKDKLKNITHKYFPIDEQNLVKKFLKHWKPKIAIFIDSEIWPNFLSEIKKRKIPLVLLNARITNKTKKRWKIISSFSKSLFQLFDLCLPSSTISKNNLINLGANNIIFIGNIKFAFNQKNILLDKKNISVLNRYLAWCAASLHKGEENFCIKTHIALKKEKKNCLTIIIPRHISNVNFFEKSCKKFGLKIQILNEGETIKDDLDILIINSFGISAKYYNYCNSIFVGKSLLHNFEDVGGQNPIEPAKLGCKIYHGKYVFNFQEIYEYLSEKNVSFIVKDPNELKDKILQDFQSHKTFKKDQIRNELNKYGENILNKTLTQIEKFI